MKRLRLPDVRSFRDFNPYAVGIVSVLLIGAVVGFAFMVGMLHMLEDTYTVKAVFADAAGTRTGDEVRVAGVKVGRVTKIEADRQHGNVVVSFVVNHGVRLGPDTTAELALATLLGTKFIRLDGAVAAPYLEDLSAEERLIPVERTKIPFDIFDLTTTATRNIQATDNAKLNQLIVSLADVTEGKREEIGALIKGIDDVAGALNSRETQLRGLLDRADRLSALLSEKDATLVELVDQSRAVLQLVSDRRNEIARGLQRGADLTTQLSSVIGDKKSAIDAILDTLHPTLDIVAAHQRTVDRALAWIGPGALGLARAGSHGPWTDIYVRALGPDVVGILGEVLGTT